MAQAPVERTRLWSTEVKLADPSPEVRVAYVFGNGRVFLEGSGSGNRVPAQEPINAPINE